MEYSTTSPVFLNSFDLFGRVAVAHQSFGAPGIEEDTFVVSFIATPNGAASAPSWFSNQRGLWTISVDVKNVSGVLREKPSRPIPVIQISDRIGTRTVSDIVVYDQIANATTDDAFITRTQRLGDHKVCFFASTNMGDIIVRGSHLDTDEDGLLDHWETMGLDFDGDGTVDLALNQAPFNASPTRKDIFVEIDYMDASPGHTHRPDRRPNGTPLVGATVLQAVTNAFAASGVPNPIGPNGITLHPMVDESLPEQNSIVLGTRGPGAHDDFHDFKEGSNAAGNLGSMCGTAPNDGHFGTAVDRSSTANCSNILGARSLAFRYAIFGHDQTDVPYSSGRGELGGNDFLVSLRVLEAANVRDYEKDATIASNSWGNTFDQEWADMQAGAFMHELGHTLGLGHGGADGINCKPNYLSVMSYGRQFNESGLAFGVPGIPPGTNARVERLLDYSRSLLNPLHEANLNENAGIVGPPDQIIVHGLGITGVRRLAPSGGSIDWNGANGLEGAVTADVNFLVDKGANCPASQGQDLLGHSDWSRLVYNFRKSPHFANGAAQTSSFQDNEQTGNDYVNGVLGSTDYDSDGIPNLNDNCVLIFNPDQADGNGNGIGDVCDGVSSNLSLTITDSPDPIQCSDSLTYTITVSNGGPNAAEGVTVRDKLPSGVTFLSATSTQGTCSGTSTVTCDVGTLASGAAVTITIVVTPAAGGTIVNMAGVGLNTTDPNLDNNSSTATTLITGYSISPTSVFLTQGGGAKIVGVTAPVGCSWTTINNDPWVVLSSGESGSGNGQITFEVRPNFTGEARFSMLTIAGQTFTVLQNTAGCAYEIVPMNATVSGSGGTGNISLTTSAECGWQALSDVNWMTITSANLGTGNAIVAYTVAPNPGPQARKGKITIGGKIFNMKQSFQ